MVTASAPVRGCGTRKKGGIYAECPLSPFGVSIVEFLFDPPILADLGELGVSPRGVTLIERDGDIHVADYVGEKFYPNVLDFVEEVRRFGLSRRLPKNLNFSKLTPASRIFLIHRRAWIDNATLYFAAREGNAWPCPKGIAGHMDSANPPGMCASLWWEDIDGGEKLPPPPDDPRWVRRDMPSFSYAGRSRPAGVSPIYRPAFFMGLPLARIVVVSDPEGGSHEEAVEKAGAAGLPVELVDE